MFKTGEKYGGVPSLPLALPQCPHRGPLKGALVCSSAAPVVHRVLVGGAMRLLTTLQKRCGLGPL